METALSFHMVDNDMQEPQTKLRLVCVMSSFHERPCHLAAVILFYYHGLACEQFEIIPNKLALIKIYSNKRFDAERLRGKTPKIKYKVYVWFRGT